MDATAASPALVVAIICDRTLSVSRGWPTRKPRVPPTPPAMISFSALRFDRGVAECDVEEAASVAGETFGAAALVLGASADTATAVALLAI